MTEVDRGGGPGELVDVDEAARMLGYANRRTIDSYLARRSRGYFPSPTTRPGGDDVGVPVERGYPRALAIWVALSPRARRAFAAASLSGP